MDTRYNDLHRRSVQRVHKMKTEKSIAGTVKLLVCLGIFLLSFLIKLIFPGLSSQMKKEILPILETSVDYRAAFSSMGRFFTGDLKFTDAFSGMVAFLISGEDAVKAGSSEDEDRIRNVSGPVLNSSIVGAHKLDEFSALLSADNTKTANEAPIFEVIFNKPVVDASEADPAQTDEVEAFINSQKLFYGYDIPKDVNVEKAELPFDYIKPVEGVVSSGFGYRVHPVDDETKFHYGIDYDAPEGTDILSFADGNVLVSGESGNLGYYLIISHGDGYITQYFHCRKLNVLAGDMVKRGQKIAEVGQTGNATSPCLHFEILLNGLYLNPEYYLVNEA